MTKNWRTDSIGDGYGSAYVVTIGEASAQEMAEAEDLLDRLSHGSGIDCTWTFTRRSDGGWNLENEWHGMDENWGYCCCTPFKMIAHFKDGKWKLADRVMLRGSGARHAHNYGIRDYLWETVSYSLEDKVAK